MKILITGGTGFLGNTLIRELLTYNHDVFLLLRKTSSLKKIQDIKPLVNIIEITNNLDLDKNIQEINPDVCIHLACNYGRKNEGYLDIFETNQLLGILIIESLLKLNKIVHFLNASTGLNRDLNVYTLSKHQFSEWGQMIAKVHSDKFKFINIQLQQIYGPGDDEAKFPIYIINNCINGSRELYLTPGDQVRDFIHIDDVVEAFCFLLKNLKILENPLNIDLGSGSPISIRDFVETVHKITNSKVKLKFGAIPYRENEPMKSIADIGYLSKLGWSPKIDIVSGLKQVIRMEKSK